MYVTIGEWWSIMKDEGFTLCIFFLNLSIKVKLVPVLEALGFSFNQICPHWEIGFRKIEGVFEVCGHGQGKV